jgi:multidrug efflux pump subunit AcrA (membrane-fusion protein)
MRSLALLPLLLAGALLSACGGGSDDAPATATANEVPATATVSVAAFASYAGMLDAVDSSEPLDVSSVTPPTSDTDEPVTL